MKYTRPGRGWVRCWHISPVWDHNSGIRVHLHGVLRRVGGEIVWANMAPHAAAWRRCIRVCGGSVRRGTMVWALNYEHGLTMKETEQC